MRLLSFLVSAFPLWVFTASMVSLWRPGIFTWFSGPYITIGLGVIMLGMGLTLEVDDFRRVARIPGLVLLGVLLQYTVMPSAGWASAVLFRLPPEFAAGIILVACCPGGTASNVISFLARADVPLSVTMTSISTILAVAMTPLLTTALVGTRVEVDRLGLLINTAQVIIIPVTAGVLLNRYLPRLTRFILPVAPLMAVAAIVLIVASIIGAGKNLILRSGLQLVAAVVSLHTFGFLLGYVLSRAARAKERAARTISIEVGMQNSGLGALLAQLNFANGAVVAIPCAISSLVHSLIGSLAAALWRSTADRLE